MKKFPSGTKRDAIEISDVSGSGFGTKPSAGKTGVSLRYHTSEEYQALTQPQKDELQDWREQKTKSTKLWRTGTQGRGQGGRGRNSGRKRETYKQGRAIAASVYKNMRSISKQKGEVGEVTLPKALIMSLFQDEDVKKAIRASVSSVEVVKEPSSKEAVSKALSAPYVAPKKTANLAASLLRQLSQPIPKKDLA